MKKQKKLLSILLAVVLVITSISTSMIAFAESNYKPQYTEKVSEQDVTDMIGDINTILDENVLTGATIEEIYKMLPSLKSIIMINGAANASNMAAFYTENMPEKFAGLTDYTEDGKSIVDDTFDEEGSLVAEGTFTKFFADHPITVESQEDFAAEIGLIIDAVVNSNFLGLFPFAFLMAGATDGAAAFCEGIDEICVVIGAEQEKKAIDCLGLDMMHGATPDVEGTRDYLKNIVAALLPDMANNVIDILQSAVSDENGPLLYDGVTKVLTNIDAVISGLSSTLKSLGVDIASVQATITEIKDTFAALPTTGEGEDKMLDIQGVVGYLVSDLTDGAVGIRFGSKPGTGGINLAFKEMQIDRVANAESNADVVKIVYDYLYDNILGNATTKSLLQGVISGLEDESVTPEMKEAILGYMELSNEDLAYEGIAAVAELAGRELPDPVEPTDPAEPTDPTDPTNPTKPSEPTTTPADNTTKADTNNTNKTVNNAKIPNTGAEAETAFTAILSAAAGVALLSIVAAYTLKRKARNI